jgi:hypothetical protein
MLTEILELYLKGSISKGNHGYQEGLGTKTALAELITERHNYKIMYEFDLKNFFPSVSHRILRKVLLEAGIPNYMIIYFLLPLLRKPKLDLELEVPDYQTRKESI